MKKLKITIALFAASCFTFTAFGQAENGTVFSIGPSVGISQTWIRNTTEDAVFKPGFTAGITTMYSAMEHFGVGLDLLYSLEGGRFESSDVESDINLQYFRIPLKFAYFFGDVDQNFRPKVSVGPTFGWLIDGNGTVTTNPGDANENTTDVEISNSFEVLDIGLNANVGFNLKLAERIWLNADIVYNHGFYDITANDNYNSNLGIRAGVAFGIR
jgi:hypothetical protein